MRGYQKNRERDQEPGKIDIGKRHPAPQLPEPPKNGMNSDLYTFWPGSVNLVAVQGTRPRPRRPPPSDGWLTRPAPEGSTADSRRRRPDPAPLRWKNA
jgi:hypothetical protein